MVKVIVIICLLLVLGIGGENQPTMADSTTPTALNTDREERFLNGSTIAAAIRTLALTVLRDGCDKMREELGKFRLLISDYIYKKSFANFFELNVYRCYKKYEENRRTCRSVCFGSRCLSAQHTLHQWTNELRHYNGSSNFNGRSIFNTTTNKLPAFCLQQRQQHDTSLTIPINIEIFWEISMIAMNFE